MQQGSIAKIGGFEGTGFPAPFADRSTGDTQDVLRELAELQGKASKLLAELDHQGWDKAGESGEDMVRGILRARQERARHFPANLFADPAWDMLLDLYAAELSQRRVSVTSLCIASNVPTTTALRWITALEKARLIERRADPLDGRRYFMSLTLAATDAFKAYFSGLSGQVLPI